MKTLTVEVKESKKRVPQMIFGHFVEFMRDCIDEGMWAQILKNRGFDKRKDIPEGVVDGNPHIAEGWFRTGYKNAFEITLDAKKSLARDGYAQKINCYNDYDGFVGIAQGNLHFHQEQYKGYIWMTAQESAKMEIIVRDEKKEELYKQVVRVEGSWKKYEFEFCSTKEVPHGVFEIRMIGEGIVWLDAASIMQEDNIDGIWKEVHHYIKELNIPIIRYPGGCFADVYSFEDGIGDIDKRPYRRNRHWGGYVDNSFGTDEFLKFCENLKCEPMICVNFGSGTPEEAANWVEYCNGSIDTKYGKLRALNGREEPYNIKYWDVGNEIFGEWEVGHSTAEVYAWKYLEFYEAMKAKDEEIIIMTCGGDGDDRSQEWNQKISEIIKDKMSALSLHMYAQKEMGKNEHNNEDVYYATVGSVKKYEEILCESFKTVNENVDREILVAVTEYNLGTIIDSYREQTLEAAILNAGFLNMFIRNSEKLLMCNYSDLVNGWPGGCIVSKHGKAFGTASYYVLQMYSQSNIKEVLDITLDAPTYSTKRQIGNIEPILDIPIIDVVAGKNAENQEVFFVVNRSQKESFEVNIAKKTCMAEVTQIFSEKTSDMNFYDEQKVFPKVIMKEAVNGSVEVSPHSVTRIRVFK